MAICGLPFVKLVSVNECLQTNAHEIYSIKETASKEVMMHQIACIF